MNANILSGGFNFERYFKAAEDLKIPEDLPVLFFLEATSTDVEGWKTGHEEQIKTLFTEK